MNLKQFNDKNYANQYLSDIRMKIPGYDLMLSLLKQGVFPIELKAEGLQHTLLIGGNQPELALIDELFPDSVVDVVDPSSPMIEVLKKENLNANHHFFAKRFEDFELKVSYQLCLSLLVIHFVQDKKFFLEKIYQGLEEDGILILSAFSDYHLDWWQQFAVSAGADPAPIQYTRAHIDSYMSTSSPQELEGFIWDCGFKRVEKICQIFPVDMWLIQK